MTRKNIVIIENHIISTNTVRRKLVEVLMDSGYNVTILSTGSVDELSISKSLGFDVINVGSSNRNPLTVAQYIKNLRKAIKSVKADLILTYTMRPAIWGNLVARTLNIPVITNITGTGPLGDSKNFTYRVARLLYSGILSRTNKVFFQNEEDKQIFITKKFVSESQTHVIPGSGVDVEFFKPRDFPNEKTHFEFLFISRLIKDKGILEYVEAAHILRQDNLPVKCSVIGPLYYQNFKENMITEADIKIWQDGDVINYLGPQNDVRPFIARADCVVLPSYREGMSNVLLETSSMERPSITSNVTGCKDIVIHNETGLLCEVRNSADFAKKMKRMYEMSETDRLKMGKAARIRVVEHFNKEIVINSYLKEIQKLTAD